MRTAIIVVLLSVLMMGSIRAEESASDLTQRVARLEADLAKLKAEKPAADDALVATWKNGFRLASRDDAFELRLRAFFQFDTAAFLGEQDINESLAAGAEEGKDPVQLQNGAEIRRARIGFEGALYESMEYDVIFDLAGDQVEPVDVYVAWLDVPVLGTVRIGHQREPISRLQGGSANYIFMEKGLQDALVPDRNLGIRVLQNAADKRVAWSAGAYYDTDKTGTSVDEGAYDLGARISGLPWYEKESGRLLHLAAACVHRRAPEDGFDFGARPDAHLSEQLAGRDPIAASSANVYGGEAALVLGPLSFLGEYVWADLDMDTGANAEPSGYYATASYFLTGETRGYETGEGKLAGVKPLRNFRGAQGGWGAWEIAARLSGLDAQDGEGEEGELKDLTLALNWYLNPNTKFLLNFIRADAGALGDVDIVQGRLQLSF